MRANPKLCFLTLIGSLTILAAAGPAPVAAGPEHGRGNIVSVDWGSMEILVRDPQGGTTTWKVDAGSKIKFSDAAQFFPRPTVKDLAPGMYIYFIYEGTTGVIYDVDVREVPPELQKPRSSAKPVDPGPGGRSEPQVKVRFDKIDQRRGEFRATVGNRSQTFRVRDPQDLDRFAPGDLAIITIENVRGEELVTAIRSAAHSGTVRGIDSRRRRITLEVGGGVETYGVSDGRLLDRLRVGDRIRFEFEDRPGMDVITAIY